MLRWNQRQESASAYLIGDRLLLESSTKTETGLHVSGDVIRSLSGETDPAEIGRAVLEVLDAYRVSHQQSTVRSAAARHPLLAAAHVKTWSKLEQVALHCSVDSVGAEIEFTPSRRASPRGYLYVPEHRVCVGREAKPERLGEALREAFSRCTQ